MRYRQLLVRLAVLCLVALANARAGDVGYISCPSGEGYVYLYQSLDSFQVLANLRCGEKVEIIDPRSNVRVKVKTLSGKEGYLPHSAVTASAPGSQQQNQQSLAPPNAPLPSASATPPISPAQAPQPATELTRALSAQASGRKHIIPRGSHVYIEPMGGFDTALKGALEKKQVPLVVVTDKTQAEYEITGTTHEKKDSTGKKVGMTVLLGFGGLAATSDQMIGSIQIVDLRTAAIVYAHTATTGDSAQSMAEACAKRIKSEALTP